MKFSIRLNAVLKIFLSICNIVIPLLVGPYIIRMLSRTSYDIYTKASVELQLFWRWHRCFIPMVFVVSVKL